ncbi:MAG: carboxypeptidase M32 [Planctomycetales bacterium]|nr:carboxypeptidase M32 [Planctomycetales bacterium]
MDDQARLEYVVSHVRETALLESTSALLEWDERTGLPSKAGNYRAEQLTYLSGLIHRRRTDREFGEALDLLQQSDLAQAGELPTGAIIRRLAKDFSRNTRLPIELVKAISRATVLGQQAWERARQQDNWLLFEPYMTEVISLRRQEAELLATDGQLYDALLDQYEPDCKSSQLVEIFSRLREQLVDLVKELGQSNNRPDGQTLRQPISIDKQRTVSRWAAESIGYDFQRGRLDETSHPFCTTLGPDDCRILTRFQETFFPSGLFGTLHEAGHGIYEQGLPGEWFGLPPGSAASLGIHESQSRLWENFVGRSQAFWRWAFPKISARVGDAWQGFAAEQIYRDANLVQPSLIRVEADEVTYNLHILIRFEIEQQLISGQLLVADAPDAWNERYSHYLGIRPPSAKDGILQDVHWSAGLVGYFPTYSLGNLYAAQLMQAAAAQLGDLDNMFAEGEFEPLLAWLRKHVHAHGACIAPSELVQRVSGQSLSEAPLMQYLRRKLSPIYGC